MKIIKHLTIEYSTKNSLLLCLHGHFIFLLNTETILKLTNYYQRDVLYRYSRSHCNNLIRANSLESEQKYKITATINSVKQLNVTPETEKQLNMTLETEKQLHVILETEKQFNVTLETENMAKKIIIIIIK
jgi:ABC-type uncharacterized transport system YnjBCD substrate-binding protein